METKTITIEQEKLQDLYNILTNYPAISKEQVIMEMHKCFGEKAFKPIDVTERVKTFEDACNELGETHPLVLQYKEIFGNFLNGAKPSNSADILAYLKLRIVTAALNEGWEPQFTDDEWRYYPWFYLWSEEELADKDEEWKQARSLRSCENHGVLFGGNAYGGAIAGFAFADSNHAPSNTVASVGSRLCFKSEALAVYAGKQFIDLYMDFNLIRK